MKLLMLLLGEMQCELVNLKKLQELHELKRDNLMDKPESGNLENVDTMETMPFDLEIPLGAKAGSSIP